MVKGLHSRDKELFAIDQPKAPVVEAFRTLRTNLSFLSPDQPLQKIMVTSCGAGDGKSLITANLAVSMAQNHQQVIIIDADLRRPMQHRFFKLTNFAGLSNMLTGEIDFKEGLRETGVEGLRIISTGVVPPNPAELLASNKMTEVLNRAAQLADRVLIDAPPVIAVADAAILANKADGAIIVAVSHQTPEEMLIKARQNLEKARANLVGVVLNKYPFAQESSYYHQYYSYYGLSKNS